jgi:hypothetical protein
MAYVNVVRRGNGNATLQNGGLIPLSSVSVRENAEESPEKLKNWIKKESIG